MPVPRRVVYALEDLAREIDLVVFRLEREPGDEVQRLVAERKRLRRELESVRDRMEQAVADLNSAC